MAADAYKDKYLSLVEEIEGKEKEWADLEQRVRRTLTHLLIIAQGPTNSKINAHLGKIRDSLKAGADLADVEAEVARIREEVIHEARGLDSGEPPPPVHEIIIRILERIPLPKDMMGRVTEIVKQLEGGLPSRMVPWAVNTVGNLVLEVRTRMEEEKEQLKALLEEITAKLTLMSASIGAAGEEALAGFDSNRSLSEKVTAQVAAIRDSASKATDLAAFRSVVDKALGAIQGHLDAKLEEDKRREESLTREVDSLKGHVGSLQEELSTHKEQLKKAMEESQRDALTGVLNRMAYEKRMRDEMGRSKRFGHHFSIVIMDLDKFKSINDTFGHVAGDQVLKAVAQIAGSQLREIDGFCRYGGEEFVAILPETELPGAMAVAEKIRKAVENFRFHSRGQRVVITLSAGVAQYGGEDKIEAFTDRADKALYRAKSEGRNRAAAAK